MRIYKNRFYVLAGIPGISGFKRWNERTFQIVTGMKAANNRTLVVSEWTPRSDEQYRMEDGHCPEYQPVGHSADVLRFLNENPYQTAAVIGRAAQRYCSRYTPGMIATDAKK